MDSLRYIRLKWGKVWGKTLNPNNHEYILVVSNGQVGVVVVFGSPLCNQDIQRVYI